MDHSIRGQTLTTSDIDTFPHCWQAEVLSERPMILPPHHFVYPQDAEEVERGAMEILIRPDAAGAPPFLATCALGFRDPAAPTGIWSVPNSAEICALSGGYAYIIDTTAPDQFTMIPYRPVLEVRPLPEEGLMLFVGHHAILAWGAHGEAWRSNKLSDEGVTITGLQDGVLHGVGWNLMTDKETLFLLDVKTGSPVQAARN